MQKWCKTAMKSVCARQDSTYAAYATHRIVVKDMTIVVQFSKELVSLWPLAPWD